MELARKKAEHPDEPPESANPALLSENDLVDLVLQDCSAMDVFDFSQPDENPPDVAEVSEADLADDDALVRELMRLHHSGDVDPADLEFAFAAEIEAAEQGGEWGQVETRVRDQIEYSTQIAEASRRFQELFQGVPIACFCYDTDGRIIEWNRACEKLFSLPADRVIEKYVWEVVGRTDDQEITRAMVISVIAGDTYESYEWEDIGEDGNLRYFLGNTYPLRGLDGEPTGGISASIDISARKYAEQALLESEERWHLAVRGNNDGIWDWNVRTGRTYFSARCGEMLGYDDDDGEIASSREEWLKYVHEDDREGVTVALEAHMSRKTEYFYAEYRVKPRDGSIRWILDRGQALWNRNGDCLRLAGSFTDITNRKEYEEQLHEAKGKLEELATRDGLTGLKNRRAFNDRLEMEFERASRYGPPLSIVLIDVDKFKSYNDTYGHPGGDAVLRMVGQILEIVTRDTDFVARYGGEEFVILLPHANAEAALRAAERCRAKIEAHSWPERPVTASFGVATLHPGVTTRDEFVKAADDALYASKESGRNRVTHFDTLK